VGIDERVKELQGTAVISPRAAGGTIIAVRLPIPVSGAEAPLARAAG
jgi:hypothetical protein